MIKKTASNWKTFIEEILVGKNGFKIVSNDIKGEVHEVTYRATDASNTSVIVTYFFRTSDLIAFRFSNPQVRGYNEYGKNAYLYSLQFTKPTTFGSPGIDFIEVSRKGLLFVFKKGVDGKEVQYLRDGVLVKSEVSIVEGSDTYVYKYRFTKSPVIDILLNKGTDNDVGLEEKTIDLRSIFPGLVVD